MKNSNPQNYDVVIVGSGIGGSTLLHGLADTGARILVLERGAVISDSPEARDSHSIFAKQHFRSDEEWFDGDGNAFNPGNYYNVGGNSKFYGAVMMRFREEDFSEMTFDEGVSPAWPITYQELAPYYQKAERLYRVRGKSGDDPCEPSGPKGYVAPPVPDEAPIRGVRRRLERAGVKPFSLPLAVDIESWMARAETPWDAFPDTGCGKMDAESAVLNPALKYSNVTLIQEAKVERFLTSLDGKTIESVEITQGQSTKKVKAGLFVLSAGAINSAALLLRSADDKNPRGLSNSSDQVGRNFMNHNCSALLAINPLRRNNAVYQKTLGINDFYLSDGSGGNALGNMQLLGKVDGTILKTNIKQAPLFALSWLAKRSVDWYVMSEDLPSAESRVRLDGQGRIVLDWQRSNMTTHHKLVKKAKQVLRAAGYPILLSRAFDQRTPSHQCGTVRMGNDPAKAPLDAYCRSYDHPNLFVVDGSFLPTSAAVNPALTIAAQALRVAEHIKLSEFSK